MSDKNLLLSRFCINVHGLVIVNYLPTLFPIFKKTYECLQIVIKSNNSEDIESMLVPIFFIPDNDEFW